MIEEEEVKLVNALSGRRETTMIKSVAALHRHFLET
jgi:hypothetical protein